MPENALPLAGKHGPETGIALSTLAGVVVDETDAELAGEWSGGDGLKGFVGWGYHYAAENSGAVADFRLKAPEAGQYAVKIFNTPHPNRGDHVPLIF